MSGSLFEGYKEALRRGHVAALRGRLDLALTAYREAARIAPDRALPYVGLGGALARLDRVDEAFGAYRSALDRAPDDEGALRGLGDLLAAQGRAAEAASAYDRLTGVLERAGRLADACDVARRALELAESRGRRRQVQDLVNRLQENAGDSAAVEALTRALSVLEVDRLTSSGDEAATAPTEAVSEGTSPEAASPEVASADGRALQSGQGDAGGPDEEPPPPPVMLPPPDPVPLRLAFEAALAAGDFEEARKGAVAASVAHRMAGQFHASIDACYEALEFAPADPGIHFALAQAYLDRGWRALAADKLVLIGRLAELTGDTATRARLCDLAVRRFPDDARLAGMCT